MKKIEKDFYYRSIQFSLDTNKLSTYDIKKLNHPFLDEIPKCLYKYRKSGELGRIDFYVGQRKIYLSSFTDLDDKFEGITPATKERVLKSDGASLCHYYKETIIQILKDRFPSIDMNLANNIYEILIYEQFDKEDIFKKSLPLVEKSERKHLKTVLSALAYIFKNIDDNLNNNSNFAKGIRELVDINTIMGAYCLCDSCDNETLWAHYADNFKGYCVEYDLSDPCKSSGSLRNVKNLFPVKYVEKKDDDWFKPLFETVINSINVNGVANQTISNLLFQKWMTEIMCTKKRSWESQNEWRILGAANTKRLAPLVSAIIVGHEISKEDFEKIEEHCIRNGFPLKITFIDYLEQKVVVRDITDEDIKTIKERSLKENG